MQYNSSTYVIEGFGDRKSVAPNMTLHVVFKFLSHLFLTDRTNTIQAHAIEENITDPSCSEKIITGTALAAPFERLQILIKVGIILN